MKHVRPAYRVEPLERRLLLATVTVTNALDVVNGNTTSISALNANQGGDGISFREALVAANNTANSGGPDVINFQITGTGVHTILFQGFMVAVTNPVVIDATTESDYAGLPRVQIDGSFANGNGLEIWQGGTGSTVRGLAITRFGAAGLFIISSNNVVEACHIGVSAAGNLAQGNASAGVYIQGSGGLTATGNRIGGTTAAQRNMISANALHGVFCDGSLGDISGTLIQGNYIGTDATGTLDFGNTQSGVFISGTPNNTVGGNVAGAGNVISGNNVAGVEINGAAANGNVVAGNFIGTNAAGTVALPNPRGVLVGSANNTIGGTTAASRNVISGNTNEGVFLDNSGNVVAGNYIGLNAAGTAAIGNGIDGVYMQSHNNTIGGPTAASRNVISGNGDDGVGINSVTGITVQNNYIGTNAAGTAGLANAGWGVEGVGASNIIGSPGAGNVISGNTAGGLLLDGSGNVAQGNLIGLNAAGTGIIPNAVGGVRARNGAATIGGTAAGAGNVVSGNNGNGITLEITAPNSTIQGNFIGTNAAGTAAVGNIGNGVQSLANSTLIGGTVAGARNVISGNPVGVRLSASVVTVSGNYIGTNAAGDAALGNTDGVVVDGSICQIGGITAAARNVISGNTGTGVRIADQLGFSNQVRGNYIGTNAAGDAALPNNIGVSVNSATNVIGGATAGERNVISGNTSDGVFIFGNVNGNRVEGNYIGINAAGTAALGNFRGVYVLNSPSSTIGGAAAGAGNVISGNRNHGVLLLDDNSGGDVANNLVLGNRIGTNPAGTLALGNVGDGILVSINTTGGSADSSRIGGTTPGERNIISGNRLHGIELVSAEFVDIQGNFIGTQADGTSPLGNARNGVYLFLSDHNEIGAFLANDPSPGNVIAHNTGNGIVVNSDSVRNWIRVNSFFGNGGLAVDLNGDGVTLNDVGDSDSGANFLQNYPVITSVVTSAGHTVISGSLNALVGAGSYEIDFYSSPAADSSGFGEGQTLLATLEGDVNATGNWSFSFDLATALPAGTFVSAIAWDAGQGTSEFSNAVQVVEVPSFSVTDVTVTEGHSGTVNATFTVNRSGNLTGTSTVLYSTANGSAVAPGDYEPVPFTQLSFAPGDTSKTVTVLVNGDTADELNETFNVNLSSPNNATIGDAQGVGTIIDDDLAGGSAELQSDPFNPSLQALVIVGTIEDDDIELEPAGGGQVRVVINGVDKGTFAPTGRVYAYGLASDDVISVNTALPMGIVYDGSSGSDALHLNAAGTFAFDADAGAATTGGLTLHVTAAGATAVFNASQQLAGLVLSNGGDATLSAGGSKVLQVQSLTIDADCTLDLTDNDLIVDYTGPSPAAEVEADVRSGYNVVGDWLGNGITSSVAALDGNFVLAVADNNTLAAPFGSAAAGPLFSGIDVDLTSVLIKFTHRVDVNLDGLITPDDAAIFGTNYDESILSGYTWGIGDMDYDGACTANDAAIFGTFYDESLLLI